MAKPEDVADNRLSRRRLLQAGTVGAGVAGAAWITPSVLSLDGASAVNSVCGTTRTMDWTVGGNGVPNGNNSAASFTDWYAYAVGGDIRVRVSFVTGTGVTRRGGGIAILGNVPANDNFQINKDGATTGSDATIIIEFVHPTTTALRSVQNLNITLLDVDKSCGTNGNFTDSVIVAPTLYGAPITPTTITLNSTYVQQSPSMTFTGIADAAGSGNTGGNVTLAFTGQNITRIAFTYRSNQAINCGDTTCTCASPTLVNPNTLQYWGLNQFTFC